MVLRLSSELSISRYWFLLFWSPLSCLEMCRLNYFTPVYEARFQDVLLTKVPDLLLVFVTLHWSSVNIYRGCQKMYTHFKRCYLLKCAYIFLAPLYMAIIYYRYPVFCLRQWHHMIAVWIRLNDCQPSERRWTLSVSSALSNQLRARSNKRTRDGEKFKEENLHIFP